MKKIFLKGVELKAGQIWLLNTGEIDIINRINLYDDYPIYGHRYFYRKNGYKEPIHVYLEYFIGNAKAHKQSQIELVSRGYVIKEQS